MGVDSKEHSRQNEGLGPSKTTLGPWGETEVAVESSAVWEWAVERKGWAEAGKVSTEGRNRALCRCPSGLSALPTVSLLT